MSAMDYYYFALITVTTVGLGDIYPTDHMRVIACIASLTGCILISCTAQYVYKTMSQQEDRLDDKQNAANQQHGCGGNYWQYMDMVETSTAIMLDLMTHNK